MLTLGLLVSCNAGVFGLMHTVRMPPHKQLQCFHAGITGQPLESYYFVPANLLATQNDTGPMDTSNITALSIIVDSTSGVTALRSLAVTYNTQQSYLIGGYNGTATVAPVNLSPFGNNTSSGQQITQYSFSIGAGEFVNSTVITYGAVPELMNATVINAIQFTTVSGAAYNIGRPDPRLFQTGFSGILKGFKGYGANTIAALGIYAITQY